MEDNTLTGGFTNYYLARVEHPQREEQEPYTAECEDITKALKMTPEEFCEFKAIWRTAAARLGNGKPGQKALYDAEKRVHYATRDLKEYQRQAVEPKEDQVLTDWINNDKIENLRLNPDAMVEVQLRCGERLKGLVKTFNFNRVGAGHDILSFRRIPSKS